MGGAFTDKKTGVAERFLDTTSHTMNIPGYQIKEKIADGGMASVYLAIQESVDRTVALKLLSKDCADQSFGDRFVREARIASKLVHPNIVTIFDAGSTDEYQYIAMEYIPGQDLAEARFRMTMEEKLAAVTEVAKALDYANGNGFVHRDIKPSNILMHENDGRAVVLDFGTAKAEESQTRMTMLGETIGTPYFMSPEQAQALSVDGRSDLYSLGVVFYTLITGEVPFNAQSSVEVGIKHVTEPVPQLPLELSPFQDFINKAMAKIPADRYQSGEEFQRAMNAVVWSDTGYAGADDDATQLMPAAVISAPHPAATDKPGTEKVPVGHQIGGWLEAVSTRLGGWVFDLQSDPKKAALPLAAVGIVVIIVLVMAFSGGEEQAEEGSVVETQPPVTETSAEDMSASVSPDTEAASSDVSLAESEMPEVADDMAVALETADETAPENEGVASEVESLEASDDPEVTAHPVEAYPVDMEAASQELAVDDQQPTPVESMPDTEEGDSIEALLARANRYFQDNALTVPEGKNAYQTYKQVLDQEPFNREALLGITRIVDKYRSLADGKVKEKDFKAAAVFVERAMGLDPNNTELPALLVTINDQLDAQVQRWSKLAQKRADEGSVLVPERDSAMFYYQRILDQDPGNGAARKALQQLAERIIPDLNLAISEHRWEDAKVLMEAAEKAYPKNLELIRVKKRFWDLRDVAAASNGPKVTAAGLSKGFMGGLFSGGNRVISVYFKYDGFGSDNHKITVSLLNGNRSETLDSEAEIITRDSGRKVVKFDDRSGFSDGWYEMDILVGQRYLHTERFKVSE